MTPTNDSIQANPDSGTVAALLERRDQLQEWLDSLGEMSVDVPARVAERVRADYQTRLAQVLEELASHVDSVTAELLRLRDALADSGERYEAAVDALEEARLRFRIGELAEADWEARRPELEAAAAEAAEVREAGLRELERLEELLVQIQGGADDEQAADRILLPELVVARPEIDGRADESDDGVEELGFLAQLDRAITADGGEEAVHLLTEEELATRPKPGTKCPDCGYTNDASAWFCGVCGVDLN